MRCLLIDDSARFRDGARRALEREGVTDVLEAGTAEQARRLLDFRRVDVLLVDIDLGCESGLVLLGELARESRLASARAIAISGHAEADFIELIQESPAIGFIGKTELSVSAIEGLLGQLG